MEMPEGFSNPIPDEGMEDLRALPETVRDEIMEEGEPCRFIIRIESL